MYHISDFRVPRFSSVAGELQCTISSRAERRKTIQEIIKNKDDLHEDEIEELEDELTSRDLQVDLEKMDDIWFSLTFKKNDVYEAYAPAADVIEIGKIEDFLIDRCLRFSTSMIRFYLFYEFLVCGISEFEQMIEDIESAEEKGFDSFTKIDTEDLEILASDSDDDEEYIDNNECEKRKRLFNKILENYGIIDDIYKIFYNRETHK